MAISIIGTPQVGNANNGGTVTLTWSTTPSNGDYTVVVIGSPADAAAIGTISTSGYTLLASHAGAAAANPSLAIWYKKQGATPDTTVAGTSGNGSTTDSSMIGFVLRGVDPTTFSDATPTAAGETTSTNPDPASITIATPGACVIVAACMTVVKDTAITDPSGYTGYSQVGDDTYDHTLAAAYKLNCSGTEAPASWTNWDSGLWYALTIAAKPYVVPPKTHTADAVIVSRNTKTHTCDAIIATREKPWYNSSWLYRVKVTVQSSQVSASINDFPVFVNLANLPAGFHAHVNQTDARDIRVTTVDGTTEVPREIVYYDSANDKGEIHFKGNISSTSNTDFYIYYGNAAASDYAVTDTYGRNNVWISSYKAVYHMYTDPSGGTSADATSNGNTLTVYNTMSSGQRIDATVGTGYDMIPNDYLGRADADSLDIAGDYTISSWVKIDSAPAAGYPIVIKIGESGAYHNYYLDIDADRRCFIGHFNGSTWVETPHVSNTQLTLGTWYYVVGVYKSADQTLTLYLNNGSQDSQLTSVTGTPSTSTQPLNIFAQSPISYYLDGKVDETRIYSGARASSTLITEYNNQYTPSSFYSAGSEEVQRITHTIDAIIKETKTVGGNWYNQSWLYRVKVTVNASQVDADLTDYPVYVDLSLLPSGFHTYVNQTDARDIRVTTSNGTTEVPREVVWYNSTSDTGELHFKGNIDGDTDTHFYIYYGNASASDYGVTDTYGRNNVWTNGYEGVFHIHEGGTLVANAYKDSSGNFTGGTGSGDLTTNSSAKIGIGVTADGTGDYIDIGTNTITGTSAFTLVAWINTDVVNKYSGAISIGASVAGQSAYIGTVQTAQGGTSNSIGGGFYGTNYGTGVTTTGSWVRVALTFAGGAAGSVNVYAGKTSIINTTYTPSLASTYTRIGRIASDTTYDFDGSIDEARISSVERTTAWMATEYENQNSPATFFTIGTQEVPGMTIDAIIAATSVKTNTIDGIVYTPAETHVISITVNGIMFASGSKTITSDGIILATQVKTNTVDGWVSETKVKSNTVDGIVLVQVIKTHTVNGVVLVTSIKTNTIDGYVAARTTKTHSSDGIIKETFVASFTVDANVAAPGIKTHTADGVILATQIKTFTIDGYVAVRTIKTSTSDGYIATRTIKTFTADGIVKETFVKTFTLTGYIAARLTKTNTVDGVIRETFVKTFTNDAHVAIRTIKTVTADGIVKETFVKTFTSGGYVATRYVKTSTADGIIRTTLVFTHEINGLIGERITKTFTSDGIVRHTLIQTNTSDAIIKQAGYKTPTADGIVLATYTKDHGVDAVISVVSVKTNTIDAEITDEITVTLRTDVLSITFGGLTTRVKTRTADGFIKEVFVKTNTIDAIVKIIETKTHTVDAIVLETSVKSHTVDGVVLVIETKTHTIDGIIFATESTSITVDGIVRETFIKSQTVDAIIMVVGQVPTFTVDAIIQETRRILYRVDGIIRETFTTSHTVDGIIFATGTVGAFTVDAIIQETFIQSHTVDAVVKAATIATHTIDGIIFATNEKTFTVDGRVHFEAPAVTITVDAIIGEMVFFNTKLIYVDGDPAWHLTGPHYTML